MRTRLVEILLLVLSGIASALASGFGLFAGLWGGLWAGSGIGDHILRLLFCLLPASSLLAFGAYFYSRALDMLWSWAIAIGSIMTLFTVNFTPIANPVKIAWGVLIQNQEWILLIPAFGLYLSAMIHNRSRSSAVDHRP